MSTRGCVTPYQLTQWQEVTDGDMELVDGLEELPEELQEKVIKAIDQGHVDDEDWKGVSRAPTPHVIQLICLGRRHESRWQQEVPCSAVQEAQGCRRGEKLHESFAKSANEQKDGGESEPELPDSPVKKKTAAKKAPAKKAQLDGDSPPAKKPAAKKGRTKKEDDDQVADPPVKKGRGRPRKPVPMESESEIDDGDESEATPPPKKKRAPAKKKAAEVEVDNDDEDEDVAPKTKPAGKKKAGGAKKAAAPKKAAAKGRKKAPVSEEVSWNGRSPQQILTN